MASSSWSWPALLALWERLLKDTSDETKGIAKEAAEAGRMGCKTRNRSQPESQPARRSTKQRRSRVSQRGGQICAVVRQACIKWLCWMARAGATLASNGQGADRGAAIAAKLATNGQGADIWAAVAAAPDCAVARRDRAAAIPLWRGTCKCAAIAATTG